MDSKVSNEKIYMNEVDHVGKQLLTVLVLLFLIDLIKILSGAYEFQENVKVHADEDKLLKQVDNTIHDELENRYSEKYERSGNVSYLGLLCHHMCTDFFKCIY